MISRKDRILKRLSRALDRQIAAGQPTNSSWARAWSTAYQISISKKGVIRMNNEKTQRQIDNVARMSKLFDDDRAMKEIGKQSESELQKIIDNAVERIESGNVTENEMLILSRMDQRQR